MQDHVHMERYKQIAEKFVHQFRSPLTGVLGYIEMLKENETSTKKKEYLEKIENGLNESFSILKQVEYFAQPVSIQRTRFTLTEMLEAVRQNFRDSDLDRIKFTIPDQKIYITSDFLLLTRMLTELLRNAVEYGDEETTDPICFEFLENGTIVVKNQTYDLSPGDLEQFILPFYTTKALHIGLGLSICDHYSQKLSSPLELSLESDTIVLKIKNIPTEKG